ncbi:lyase family protein [Pseudofrankia sp. BMG5.37]|nr:lyase family protein [Pseudofrankia sp. BMG5.37]
MPRRPATPARPLPTRCPSGSTPPVPAPRPTRWARSRSRPTTTGARSSSIMPGKVNPTQAEAMLMVCIQVVGSDTAVAMAGSEGNFELNAFRPIVITNLLHSVRILADAADHFREFLVEGTRVHEDQLRGNVERSVMMVTALSPVIGYDRASDVAHLAIDQDLTLKQAALQRGISAELFDRVVRPKQLTRPGTADRGRSGRGGQARLAHGPGWSGPRCRHDEDGISSAREKVGPAHREDETGSLLGAALGYRGWQRRRRTCRVSQGSARRSAGSRRADG